jgi:hypothetical protein
MEFVCLLKVSGSGSGISVKRGKLRVKITCFTFKKKKSKVVPLHAMVAHGGGKVV